MSKVIQFPKIEKGMTREKFKELCHDVIDRIEGDFSLSFSNEEDIFVNPPKCDTLILTTNKEKHREMNSSFKNKWHYTQKEE